MIVTTHGVQPLIAPGAEVHFESLELSDGENFAQNVTHLRNLSAKTDLYARLFAQVGVALPFSLISAGVSRFTPNGSCLLRSNSHRKLEESLVDVRFLQRVLLREL